jgi:O-antigen/teichoic acid export membrane protein
MIAVKRQTAGYVSSEVSDDVLRQWKKSAQTFFMFSIFSMIYLRADMLCLGFYESPVQLGVYKYFKPHC